MAQQVDFDITPTEAELAKLDRRFEFQPSSVTNPTSLSGEQVESFNENGFIAPLDVFDSDEISQHRGYFDALLANVVASGGDAYSISTAHLKYGPVYDILTNERIVSYVADLLGPNVIGWGSHYFCKLPGDEKSVDWHQDSSYWPLTPTRTVTVWLAIDDCDLENGCMQFVAGSHRLGHLQHDSEGAAADSVLGRGVKGIDGSLVFDNPLRAGQVSIHSDLLVHGSAANRSSRRRCGLTLRYCPPEVRAALGWERKGVVVAGVDQDSYWSNPPRPDVD